MDFVELLESLPVVVCDGGHDAEVYWLIAHSTCYVLEGGWYIGFSWWAKKSE